MFHPIKVEVSYNFYSKPTKIDTMKCFHAMYAWLDKHEPKVELESVDINLEDEHSGRYITFIWTNFANKKRALKFNELFCEDDD